jgi:hypothetical protein
MRGSKCSKLNLSFAEIQGSAFAAVDIGRGYDFGTSQKSFYILSEAFSK